MHTRHLAHEITRGGARQAEMAEQMAANQRVIEDCDTPWEQRIKDARLRYRRADPPSLLPA